MSRLSRDPATRGALAASAAVALFAPATSFAQPAWSFHGAVVDGHQLDAVRGPDDRIHVISSSYAQIDVSGSVLVEEDQGDERQGSMDFPPAIAAGADGSIHIVTRHGGSWDSGHDIRYRRRNADGQWDRDYLVGAAAERNYVVGVAWASGAELVLFVSEAGADVWGDLRFWQPGASDAVELGVLTGVWRADADARMRGQGDRLGFVSGEPDPDGTAYSSSVPTSGGLPGAIAASMHEHRAGTGRRGFPDLYVDPTGATHLTYGAEETVFYNRLDDGGQLAFAEDIPIFDSLGSWHLSVGLSAVAATDDGTRVLAVALGSDGSQGASDSDILWCSSSDSGQSWSAPLPLGPKTDAGEGRHRPRLVAIGGQIFLLFVDKDASGISLASIALATDEDGDGYPDDTDCDDTDAAIYPGAPERCNGADDDCDGSTDEDCACVDGEERACGTDVGACVAGVQRCVAEQWGGCEWIVPPADEVCDGLDNDCDGEVDEACLPGTGGAAASGNDGDPSGDEGCGCRLGGPAEPWSGASLALGMVALLCRRRREALRPESPAPIARPRGARASAADVQPPRGPRIT